MSHFVERLGLLTGSLASAAGLWWLAIHPAAIFIAELALVIAVLAIRFKSREQRTAPSAKRSSGGGGGGVTLVWPVRSRSDDMDELFGSDFLPPFGDWDDPLSSPHDSPRVH